VLLGGEAGSGKSRLVRELAHEVACEGVLVLYGACDAVVQTPYRPFAEALDQLVRGTGAAQAVEYNLLAAKAASAASAYDEATARLRTAWRGTRPGRGTG
jgi:predicted ATP-dependent serine protease